MGEAIEEQAALAGARGEVDVAARLLGAVAASRADMEVVPLDPEDRKPMIASIKGRLGADAFEVAFNDGRSLGVEEMVAGAFAELRGASAAQA